MAHSMDNNGRDSSSTRSGGAGAGGGSTEFLQSSAMAKPPAQTTLTASSSSNYASSVSSDSQIQTGGLPGTPVTRRSGGWDRQTLSPAVAAREDHVVKTNSIEDSSDSSDEFVASYKPVERGSRSKRFFQAFVAKFTKSSVRYGLVPNSQQEQDRNVIQHTVIINIFKGLHLSPITSRPKRVLDVGTGPGTWALEFATKYPSCSVLGVDIEPVRPPYTKSNCSFKTFDITHDWDIFNGGNFDFIHIRQLGLGLAAGGGQEVPGGGEEGDWEYEIPFIYDINYLLCPKAGTRIIDAIEFCASFGLGVSVDFYVGIFYATVRKYIVLGYGISSL
nr:hypothetical protein FVER53263_10536 [Fusarium verticillioides]